MKIKNNMTLNKYEEKANNLKTAVIDDFIKQQFWRK